MVARRTWTSDCSDTSWLPPHMPPDVMRWEAHPRLSEHGFVKVRGTHAYEFICVPDGRAVEIVAYQDGEPTHHWRRLPLDGVWPGTYVWQAIAVYGQGLVR